MNRINEIMALIDESEYHLKDAQGYLKKSKAWGIVDLLGGELFTTYIKRNNMKKAQKSLKLAKVSMEKLQYELNSYGENMNFEIEDSRLFSVFDYLFDNFFSDIMVQAKINKASEQVESSLNSLHRLRQALSTL